MEEAWGSSRQKSVCGRVDRVCVSVVPFLVLVALCVVFATAVSFSGRSVLVIGGFVSVVLAAPGVVFVIGGFVFVRLAFQFPRV